MENLIGKKVAVEIFSDYSNTLTYSGILKELNDDFVVLDNASLFVIGFASKRKVEETNGNQLIYLTRSHLISITLFKE